ncbi:hypothetical protein SKAU_G00019670 [Synaphobranchus kaupii]|uniref:Uncharacterized protein n=1 Tax=Synaphobranchus kaupii TaxID=118154 RepID=A0A9Q1GCX5_SYNKA|nr:hypothetical protein SKAU_G00019670 [Synaphobranchus kaupii]
MRLMCNLVPSKLYPSTRFCPRRNPGGVELQQLHKSGLVQLVLDYSRMAADQATDPSIQTLKSADTGLHLEAVAFGDSGATLLRRPFALLLFSPPLLPELLRPGHPPSMPR